MQQCEHIAMTWLPTGAKCTHCEKTWSFMDIRRALLTQEQSPTLQDIADMLKPRLTYLYQINKSLRRIKKDVRAIRREMCQESTS